MTDTELVRLIADAEIGKDAALQVWLDATPATEANDALRRVALNALNRRPVPSEVFLVACAIFIAAVAAFAVVALLRRDIGALLWPLLVTAAAVGVYRDTDKKRQYQKRYAKARFAVLWLARRGDRRALPLLISAWQYRPKPSRRAWNEQVAVALTQLLDAGDAPPPSPIVQEQLRKLGEKLLFGSRMGRAGYFTADLSLPETYLAVAIVRCLQQSDLPQNRAFVERAASVPGSSLGANDQFVHEVAQTLQEMQPVRNTSASESEQIIVSSPPVVTVATVEPPAYQPLRRKV